jgi:uncharacterized protein with PQ loop repeat
MNNILSIIIGFILILGTIFSYGVQFHKIIINNSINGINLTSIVMGTISSSLTMYASILLNLDKFEKFTIKLDVSQLIIVCACWLFYTLIYIFCIRRNKYIELYHYNEPNLNRPSDKYIYGLFFTSWVVFIIFGIVSFIIPDSKVFINIMFFISSFFSLLQWIPQVIESYTTSTISTLSLITLSINTCGCILTVIYQSIINGEKILLMIPYIVSAILQILIIFILKCKKPRPIFDLTSDELIRL